MVAREADVVKATIHERGNGFPDVGDYVSDDGEVYRVITIYGSIHTGAPGVANYVHATVEHADWTDVGEDEDPTCNATIADDPEDPEESPPKIRISHHCHVCGIEVTDHCPDHPNDVVDSIASTPC